jgi:hypothetical protein
MEGKMIDINEVKISGKLKRNFEMFTDGYDVYAKSELEVCEDGEDVSGCVRIPFHIYNNAAVELINKMKVDVGDKICISGKIEVSEEYEPLSKTTLTIPYIAANCIDWVEKEDSEKLINTAINKMVNKIVDKYIEGE